MTRPLRVAMVAGEPSADRQGAALLDALRRRAAPRPVEAWGIGGAFMQGAGVRLFRNSDPWATIGIVGTLANIPYLMATRGEFKRALAADPPDVLVLIDAGAFNVPLARWVRQRRLCPIFYYFPPGSWRRTPYRGKQEMGTVTDKVVTPFPWSEENLRRAGADAHFVGHPLLDLVKPSLADAEFYARYGLDPRRPLVALLPGSRRTEIRHILPALLGAADEISRRIPGVQFALALASGATRELTETIIRREQKRDGRAVRVQLLMSQAGERLAQIAQTTLPPPLPRLATTEGLTLPPPAEAEETPATRPAPAGPAPLVICEGLTYDVMARSDLVITKSGTSTLEAAILHKPMIIVYRVSTAMTIEYRLRRPRMQITHIGLPNILAGERLVPELLQDDASPEGIAALAVEMLLQPERLLTVRQKLAALVASNLGEPGGVERAAALLHELATTQGEHTSRPQ